MMGPETIDPATGEVSAAGERMGLQFIGQPPDLAKLFGKMAKVLGEVHRVPKRGRNTQQSYDYATESDLMDVVRPALAEAGLAFIPTVLSTRRLEGKTAKGNPKTIMLVTMQTAFCCSETGAMVISTWEGEAEDSGDKATWKAYTGTMKYAQMKTWMVPTGDDPEQDRPQRSERRERQDEGGSEEMHVSRKRRLEVLKKNVDSLPDRIPGKVGEKETDDVKRFVLHNWKAIEASPALAAKAGIAVDEAHKLELKERKNGNGKQEASAEANPPGTSGAASSSASRSPVTDGGLISEKQLKRFHAIAKQEHGWSDEAVKRMLAGEFGLGSSAELTRGVYEQAVERLGDEEMAETYFEDPNQPSLLGASAP